MKPATPVNRAISPHRSNAGKPFAWPERCTAREARRPPKPCAQRCGGKQEQSISGLIVPTAEKWVDLAVGPTDMTEDDHDGHDHRQHIGQQQEQPDNHARPHEIAGDGRQGMDQIQGMEEEPVPNLPRTKATNCQGRGQGHVRDECETEGNAHPDQPAFGIRHGKHPVTCTKRCPTSPRKPVQEFDHRPL